MADLLKYIYNESFFSTYSRALEEVLPDFDRRGFLSAFSTPHWAALELKQRMAYLTHITQKWLPRDFGDKVAVIIRLIRVLRENGVRDQNLEYIFLADIIVESGIEDLETSVAAIEQVTTFTSFEFAGRPFILKYQAVMMDQMLVWAGHKDANVRRFASEGCRPRLPWGLQLKMFVRDPSPIIPVLERLKADSSDYVLKSVANNLNDISKDHPGLVRDIIRKWKGTEPRTDKMLRQAARTLLKTGDAETLLLFGHNRDARYVVKDFVSERKAISLGESLTFGFTLVNTGAEATDYRVEYNVWFVKSGGQLSRKIFKIAEKRLGPGEEVRWSKSHRFADLTTRRHFAGKHRISIVINGREGEFLEFDLLVPELLTQISSY